MRRLFQTGLVSLLAFASASAAPVPKVILDTDIGGDYDDVGAMATMHALADLGECEVLAVGSCSVSRDAVPCIEILNDYYGRTFLPVGGVPDWPREPRACGDFWHKVKWPEVLKAKYRRYRHETSAEAPDAVRVYRRALADAPELTHELALAREPAVRIKRAGENLAPERAEDLLVFRLTVHAA